MKMPLIGWHIDGLSGVVSRHFVSRDVPLALLRILPLHNSHAIDQVSQLCRQSDLYTYHMRFSESFATTTCFSTLETSHYKLSKNRLRYPHLTSTSDRRNLQTSTLFPLPSSRSLPALLYTFKYAVIPSRPQRGVSEAIGRSSSRHPLLP